MKYSAHLCYRRYVVTHVGADSENLLSTLSAPLADHAPPEHHLSTAWATFKAPVVSYSVAPLSPSSPCYLYPWLLPRRFQGCKVFRDSIPDDHMRHVSPSPPRSIQSLRSQLDTPSILVNKSGRSQSACPRGRERHGQGAVLAADAADADIMRRWTTDILSTWPVAGVIRV